MSSQQEQLEARVRYKIEEVVLACIKEKEEENWVGSVWNGSTNVAIGEATKAITALIQEAERKVQVKCAAEMSILDQEIQSLKAQIQEAVNEGYGRGRLDQQEKDLRELLPLIPDEALQERVKTMFNSGGSNNG